MEAQAVVTLRDLTLINLAKGTSISVDTYILWQGYKVFTVFITRVSLIQESASVLPVVGGMDSVAL